MAEIGSTHEAALAANALHVLEVAALALKALRETVVLQGTLYPPARLMAHGLRGLSAAQEEAESAARSLRSSLAFWEAQAAEPVRPPFGANVL